MKFFPAEIIRKKRDGLSLSREEIQEFILQYISGAVPDYQMSAFLMTVFFQGMNSEETVDLVRVMRDSGQVLHLEDIPGFRLDKHSTGGVGDKISLILAPLWACFDIRVPMISGRGLAHSGGTLDKLESIPGLNTRISLNKFKRVLKEVGFVIAGQTEEMVPADQKIYALRDATATIESLPLVVASIMSKKLAEDLQGLILDVKTGKGAFFHTRKEAVHLAQKLIAVGEDFNVPVRALLTNMDQPVGYACGNWVEVAEAVECLQGKGPRDIMDLVYALALIGLQVAGFSETADVLLQKTQQAIASGAALEKFIHYVELMGGDPSYIQDIGKFRLVKVAEVRSRRSGYIHEIDAYRIGVATMLAGAGRRIAEEGVHPGAGIRLHVKIGDPVKSNQLLAEIYSPGSDSTAIRAKVQEAVLIEEEPPSAYPLIFGEISREGKLIAWGNRFRGKIKK